MAEKLITLIVDDAQYETCSTPKFLRRQQHVQRDPRRIIAHIPGVIVELTCAPGAEVRRGEPLLVLEAMKMKNAVGSPLHGVVGAVHVREGQMVAKGDLLVELQ